MKLIRNPFAQIDSRKCILNELINWLTYGSKNQCLKKTYIMEEKETHSKQKFAAIVVSTSTI
jgi:hypothetical protein